MDTGLEEPDTKRLKIESDRSLNFATSLEEIDFQNLKRPKAPRDPMSHRIIEKRRRDRMNNCLADLSRLIPSTYIKQGQGRIEKTEIIELATKHIKTLQMKLACAGLEAGDNSALKGQRPCCVGRFYMGFKECQDEVMRFLVEVEGASASDNFCALLMDHLNKIGQKLLPPVPSTAPPVDKPEKGGLELGEQLSNSRVTSPFPSNGFPLPPPPEPPAPEVHLPNNGLPILQPRDKQLRNLLSLRDNLPLWNSGSESGCSQQSSTIEVPKAPADSGVGTASSSGSMDFCPDLERAEIRGSSKDTGYKFKHSITKRFSQEEQSGRQHQTSDTSSSSSREREAKVLPSRRRLSKNKARSHGSGSSAYPASVSSNASSNGSGSGSDNKEMEGFSPTPLPGFVLHPMGTHYVPISIHPTNIPEIFRKVEESSGPVVFHPISIPVHFTGPFLALSKISLTSLSPTFPPTEESGSLSASSPEKSDNAASITT